MMFATPRIGLMPLYLKLYDDRNPELRREFEPFIEAVTAGFRREGIEVVRAPVCRTREEFERADANLETEMLDLLVTLHLAYSPSLESADILADASCTVLMLDTTMDYDFGQEVLPQRLMFNHGIHGLQDLASMLRRRGKRCHIVAGHVTESDVVSRAANVARAAYAANRFSDMRALRIGNSFSGMGDFAVEDETLARALGITSDQFAIHTLAEQVAQVRPEEIDQELAADRTRFEIDLPEDVHRRSVKVGLGLRRLLDEGEYDAFSMNFLAFDSNEGPVDTVPFLEASKAMERGVGYAGEGDVLTASLVGALSQGFGKTTFTEMFCPDWKGNAIFISHMGEFNPACAATKPRLCEKEWPFTNAKTPAILTCAPAPGPATLVNLAPGPDDSFSLIVAPVQVLPDETGTPWRDWLRGWIRPAGCVPRFLERYSESGGTHHCALMIGDRVEPLKAFAEFAGLECHILQEDERAD
ncbi:MAG: hypothetical protein HY706_01540 [Candidatus Hydrogenedentes bacterium]|nr:hypothetical protein [Candidatus Hydrogenedentota bacterium]